MKKYNFYNSENIQRNINILIGIVILTSSLVAIFITMQSIKNMSNDITDTKKVKIVEMNIKTESERNLLFTNDQKYLYYWSKDNNKTIDSKVKIENVEFVEDEEKEPYVKLFMNEVNYHHL